MLEVSHVTKKYGKNIACNDLSFTLEPGSVTVLLEKFEFSDKSKKFGDELSRGTQQKLNLCLGLLPDPEVLLLDEPMIGLDPHRCSSIPEHGGSKSLSRKKEEAA